MVRGDQRPAPARLGRVPDARLPRHRGGRRQRLRRHVPEPREPAQPDDGREGPRLDDDADPREWRRTSRRSARTAPGIAGRSHHRQLGYYDPKTKKFKLIDTCYGTHHLQFDKKACCGSSGDSLRARLVRPEQVRPGPARDRADGAGLVARSRSTPTATASPDTPIVGFNYGIIPNHKDGSVWTAQLERRARADHAATTRPPDKFEQYIPPTPGYGPRGVDVDSKGIIWAALGGSGHLASFDRSKCTQTWGDGTQCAEGWTFYKSPGPLTVAVHPRRRRTNADFHYYLWVDQFNTLGLGKDTVILNGTDSDSLLAFNQKTKKCITIRDPVPAERATSAGSTAASTTRTPAGRAAASGSTTASTRSSTTRSQHGYVGHAQLRPDPLAR